MQTHHIHTSSPDAIEEENNLPTPEVLQVNMFVPPLLRSPLTTVSTLYNAI